MSDNTNLLISGKDDYVKSVTTIVNANKNFKKDLNELQTKLKTLNKTKFELKIDLNNANNVLKEAEKKFNKTGKALDKLKYETANTNFENVRRNFDLLSDSAKQTEKDIHNLVSVTNKAKSGLL